MYVNIGDTQVTGFAAFLILIGVCFIAYGVPAMLIAKRASGKAWPGVLMAIPFVNVIAIWVFAFAQWRNNDEAGRR